MLNELLLKKEHGLKTPPLLQRQKQKKKQLLQPLHRKNYPHFRPSQNLTGMCGSIGRIMCSHTVGRVVLLHPPTVKLHKLYKINLVFYLALQMPVVIIS